MCLHLDGVVVAFRARRSSTPTFKTWVVHYGLRQVTRLACQCNPLFTLPFHRVEHIWTGAINRKPVLIDVLPGRSCQCLIENW